jgi:hypothetical protein
VLIEIGSVKLWKISTFDSSHCLSADVLPEIRNGKCSKETFDRTPVTLSAQDWFVITVKNDSSPPNANISTLNLKHNRWPAKREICFVDESQQQIIYYFKTKASGRVREKKLRILWCMNNYELRNRIQDEHKGMMTIEMQRRGKVYYYNVYLVLRHC